MKPDAVSIPTSYTSFIAPVSSAKLHQEAKAQAYHPTDSSHGPMGQPNGYLRAMETPYVVRSHSAAQTHDEKVSSEETKRCEYLQGMRHEQLLICSSLRSSLSLSRRIAVLHVRAPEPRP